MNEVDPNGKSANEPGAKLDAGKVRPALVIQGFRKALLSVSEVGTFGAAKYTDNGWKSVPDGRKRYEDALYRHLLAEGVDEQSGLPHLAHAAWNLLAMLELELEKVKWFDAKACAEELSQAGKEVIDRLHEQMRAVKSQVSGSRFTPQEVVWIEKCGSAKMWEFAYCNHRNEALFEMAKGRWESFNKLNGVNFIITNNTRFKESELCIDGIHVPTLPAREMHSAIMSAYQRAGVMDLLHEAGIVFIISEEMKKRQEVRRSGDGKSTIQIKGDSILTTRPIG